MCVSRSRTVISRLAGTTLAGVPATAPAGAGTNTVVFLKDGMYRETGSERPSRPSSTSIIAATLVTALDIDAMRKIVSVFMATPALSEAFPQQLAGVIAALAGMIGGSLMPQALQDAKGHAHHYEGSGTAA